MSDHELTDDEIGKAAVKIANSIERLCVGEPTPAVLIALSMVLGATAADARRPGFHGLMRLATLQAWETFQEKMQENRNG